MERTLLICLHLVLFNITCYAVSLMGPEKITVDKSLDKILRSGRDRDDDDEPTTEMPQGQLCLCSKIYDPVCASNSESYFNLCYLECKVSKSLNVTVVHQGNCIPYTR